MLMFDLVSVIIPNYNYGRYLSDAINSVLNQTYSNIELIVVNNGSTDDSNEILKSFQDKLVVINQDNRGQSGARNRGLQASSGNLIAFLDADDTWRKDKLEKQIRLISSEKQLVYCGIQPFGKKREKVMEQVRPKYRGDCKELFHREIGASVVLSGESTALLTRELYNKIGGFDRNLNSSAGWDFFRRCSKVTHFDYVDEPLVNYRLHDNNMSSAHSNVVKDMRFSYNKLVKEEDYGLAPKDVDRIMRKAEWHFLKTFARKRDFLGIWDSSKRIIQNLPTLC
jgi:glycosyltransferase involved in cell wall biosynthesis